MLTMKRVSDQLEESPPSVSIVVPVYRAERYLEALWIRIRDVMESLNEDFEMIFVDDCGGDDSWGVIQQLAQQDNRIHGIRLSRNFGQHAATFCGIAHSRGQWIVTLDDDLEHPPESIPDLLEKARNGFSLVYGVYPDRSHAGWRNLTSALARALFRLAIPGLNDVYTSFRVISGDISRELARFESPFPFIDGYLSWITNECATVEVVHGQRAQGESNYTFRKLLSHTISIFVTFSDLPLRLASWIGIVTFIVGMLCAVGIVAARLLGGITVSGFTSMMVGITIFGGLQLLVLGVIGHYLGRVNFWAARKPMYLVGAATRGVDR